MAKDAAAQQQYDKWLQTEYAAAVANRLTMFPMHSEDHKKIIKKCHAEGAFKRLIYLADAHCVDTWTKAPSDRERGLAVTQCIASRITPVPCDGRRFKAAQSPWMTYLISCMILTTNKQVGVADRFTTHHRG